MKDNKKILFFLVILFTIITSRGTICYSQTKSADGYEWLKHARIFIVDGYNYPLCPELEFNAVKMAGTMSDMHANVLRIATSGHCGWMIPGTRFQVTPGLGKRDILAECIEACKPLGIKVIPYINTSHTQKTSTIDPDWAQKLTPAGDYSSSWSMGEKVTPICFNSSYREAFYDLIKIVVSSYDIDGIYFDTWVPFYFFGGKEKICYCNGCRKGFRKSTGLEIPYRANPDEYTKDELKTLDQYRAWWKEELFMVFMETKRIVKSFKDIPLIYNINDPETIMNSDYRILEGTDGFLYERGRSMIERAEGVSLANAHGLSVWPYIGTYDPFPRIPHFGYELGQEIYTSVAFGGSPVLYHTYFFTGHPEARGIIKDAFSLFDENDRFIRDFTSAKFCAVVWNDSDPPGHSIRGGLWDTDARLNSLGSFSACIHEHIQATSLLLRDLENYDLLSRYKVLFLPDICYVTDKQAENIDKFVKNGGGLVMTYATSLYDKSGNKRSDFSLGMLASIRYHSPDSAMQDKISRNLNFGSGWDIYLKARKDQETIGSPLAGELIPAHLYETADALNGGKIIADIVTGRGNEPITPGVVISSYGKGKVAYIASATGAMFQQTGIMQYADFLKDIIAYVSPAGLPYEIEAPPSTLITNMTEQENKRVFHMVVWTGNQNERMWQNVYYIPKIENVTVKFKIPPGRKIRSVYSFVPSDIKQKQDKGIFYITIPFIDRYQGLVIDME